MWVSRLIVDHDLTEETQRVHNKLSSTHQRESATAVPFVLLPETSCTVFGVGPMDSVFEVIRFAAVTTDRDINVSIGGAGSITLEAGGHYILDNALITSIVISNTSEVFTATVDLRLAGDTPVLTHASGGGGEGGGGEGGGGEGGEGGGGEGGGDGNQGGQGGSGGNLQVTFTDNEGARSGIRATYEPAGGGTLLNSSPSNAQGISTVTGLAAGDYVVRLNLADIDGSESYSPNLHNVTIVDGQTSAVAFFIFFDA